MKEFLSGLAVAAAAASGVHAAPLPARPAVTDGAVPPVSFRQLDEKQRAELRGQLYDFNRTTTHRR